MGFEVTIESGAGLNSGFTDKIFEDVGANIASDTKATLKDADIIFKIQRLMTSKIKLMKSQCVKRTQWLFLICLL